MTAAAEVLRPDPRAGLRLAVQAVVDEEVRAAGLTGRQVQIVNRLIDGEAFKIIADELGMSRTTCRTHSEEIYRKLKVNSRAELVAKLIGRRP